MSEREELTAAVASLEGLSAFIARRAWAFEWMLFGRFILITGLNGRKVARVEWRTGIDPDDLAPVLPANDARALFRQGEFGAFSFSWPIDALPDAASRCPGCGAGWTIENFWARHVQRIRQEPRDKYVLWHRRCWALRSHLDEIEHFRTIFAQVPGVATAPIVPTENGYSRDEPRPWFKLLLPGGDITIGWRRSVINISCPDYVNAEELFPGDNVTKGRDHIHAHGTKKAVEYLTAIADKMRHPVVAERGAR